MSGVTALECPHPGAVKHIQTISIPLNWATWVLCLLFHESSTFATVLRTSSACCTLVHQNNNGHYGQMAQ